MNTATFRSYSPGHMSARVLTEDEVNAAMSELRQIAAKLRKLCPDRTITLTYRHGHVSNSYKWQAREYTASVTFGDGRPVIDWSRERTTNNKYVTCGWYYKPATLDQRRAVRSLRGLPATARALSIRVL